MKTRLLIILFVLILIPVQLIYAPPQPNPKAVFDYAEHVVVGKILSVKILSKPDVQISENMGSIRAGIALYEIEVEEYLKNPLNTKIITVPGHYVDQEDPRSGFHLLYKVNQRVLLYIQADYPNALVDYDLIISDSESRVLDGPVCNVGTSYHEGVCIGNMESLSNGETIGYVQNTFGWFVLAMSLFIVFAYIVMKFKRRKNEN